MNDHPLGTQSAPTQHDNGGPQQDTYLSSMADFTVDTGARRQVVQGAEQAIVVAARDVYLSPHQRKAHVQWLESTGRTAWAYGFSTALIARCNQQPAEAAHHAAPGKDTIEVSE